MEGLEISVLNLSEINFENEIFRIDSEFQLKLYTDSIKFIANKKHQKFDNLISLLTDGKHGGVSLTQSGVVFLRTTNIKENNIDISDLRFISEKESEETLRAEFNENDLLLTTIGTVGLCAKVPKYFPRATINQNLVRIVLKDIDKSSFLCCFLNSKYGKNQLLRYSAGNVYQMINYPNIRKILIPEFDKSIYLKINDLYLLVDEKRQESKQTYTQAVKILLQEVGLDATTNPDRVENVNVKSFKDSFGITGRLDAEYYQKKYEDIIEKIKTQKYDTLKSITTINKSIEPGSNYYSNDETGLPFMRISDFSKFGLTDPNKRLTLDFVKDNQDKIDDLMPKKNTILFSKDGTVGIAHQLREDFKGITSSAILHLKVMNENEVLPEYLTLVLNSKLVQMQAERDAGGSIIQHWRKEEIENVIVPIIDYKKQQEIAQLIEESFSLKKQSEHLLEVAKRAVEIAIEENEEVANEYIKKQLEAKNASRN